VFLWLANWWDGVDLWLSELAFPFQFAIVIAVLAPFCITVAWVIDRAVDLVSARRNRTRTRQDQAPPAVVTPTPAVAIVRADVPAGTPATIITSAPGRPRPADDQLEARVTAGRGSNAGAS
jgi:hypothetical protein